MRRGGVARGDFESNFAGLFLTLFYESALMPAIKEGTPVGAGVLCVSSSPPPGIDRGGGFCLQASGWSGCAIFSRGGGVSGKEGLIFCAFERMALRSRL